MGKLTALIVGYISVTFSAYVLLSVSFNPLVNWIGPYFGYRFPFILGIIYLIAGSPIRNTVILETWVIIGVLVGISARKGFRAWGSASLVYMLTTATLSISLLAMLGISLFSFSVPGISATLSGLLSTFIAASAFLPYGTNVATIATEPVLRIIAPYLASSIRSGSGTAGMGIALREIIISVVENYIIFVVTAIVVGMVTHRILHKKNKMYKKAIAAVISIFIALIFVSMAASAGMANTANAQGAGNVLDSAGIPAAASNQLFPFSITNGTAHMQADNGVLPYNSASNSSSQAGLSLITPGGNLYNMFAFENGTGTSTWSGNNLMFGGFSVTANMTSVIEKEYGINQSKLGAFAPQNALILAYNGTGHSGNAKSMAASMGSKIGTTFKPVFALKNVTLAGYPMTVYLYSSMASEASLKSDFMKAFNSGYTGSIHAIFGKDEGLNNYNSYAMVSGYINKTLVNSAVGKIGLNVTNVDFTAGIFKYSNYFHSSGDHHTYNISTLMNYNSKITFSPSSRLSVLGIGYNNGTGNSGNISKYIFNIYSNNASLAGKTPLNTTGSSFVNKKNAAFSPSAVSVSFNAIFPAYIIYSTSVERLSRHTVEITVHIKNNDTAKITQFNATQAAFVHNYVKHKAASFISGKYNETNMTLKPGSYANFTYNMTLSGIGIYVIPYTNMSYNFQGKAFSYDTNATYIVQNKPGYIIGMNSMINGAASQYTFLGNTLYNMDGFAISIIDLLLFAIIGIDVAIEIRALRFYMERRK
jgi:hypothetical protein